MRKTGQEIKTFREQASEDGNSELINVFVWRVKSARQRRMVKFKKLQL